MTELTDSDWELINAYADGELNGSETRTLEARLANEPELQEALEQVRRISGALRNMRPEFSAPGEAPTVPANRNWRPLAVCASLVAAVTLVTVLLLFPADTLRTAAEIHNEFLDKSYTLSDVSGVRPASLATGSFAPDLGMANLFLVDEVELSGNRTAAHYSGRNNCRLTLLSGPEIFSAGVPEEVRNQQWQIGDRHFALLASGMDQRRFDAIAVFLRQATRSSGQPETALAMKQATDTALPCQHA